MSNVAQSSSRTPPLADDLSSKVPEVTLGFWIIKIAATTLGETGGDTVTMSLNWGYLAGTLLFLCLLVALVIAQILARKFHPLARHRLYRRFYAIACLSRWRACALVLVARDDFG
jgi:uncharacterized membrane-anchored protein